MLLPVAPRKGCAAKAGYFGAQLRGEVLRYSQ